MGLIAQHLDWCNRKELRPNYVNEVRVTLRRLTTTLGPLEHATEPQIEAWWQTLDVSPGTRIAYLAHLSGFYRWLIYERLRDTDPTARLIRPKVRRGIPRPISDQALQRALGAAGQPVRSWLMLAAFMGFRACEIAPLCREDIRTDLGVIVILDGKGGRQRTVPLHPEVARCLEYGPASGPLFRHRKTGPPISANAVSQGANRYLHELGISETLHQLRHWFATNVYRNSNDLRLTQELLGHASPTTTALYAAWNPAKAAGVIESLSA